MNLASPLECIDALLCGDYHVAVKVGPALLEFSEVLDSLKRALRPEQPFDIDTAQGCGLDAMPKLLRALFADQVESSICMAVSMTIKARYAAAGTLRPPVLGLI